MTTPTISKISDELVEEGYQAWLTKLSEFPNFDIPGLTLAERLRRQHLAGIRAALEAVYLRRPRD